MSNERLARLIGAGPLLLDFDGPVCSVFAGYPAPEVASELIDLLVSIDVDLPEEVRGESDPMEVLRWAGAQGAPKVLSAVEDALCEAELRAVAVADPTPFGHELIERAAARGLPIAVVSNNSASSVRAYLTAYGLLRHVAPVVGRAYADPARMKPDPRPVLDAARLIGARPGDCTLVGDSLSDIDAARSAGAKVVGYANRPWKVDAFSGADTVVTSMRELAEIWTPAGWDS